MVFIYPAIISENVDKRFLSATIKTLELYFMHQIAEAVSTGQISFKVFRNPLTGRYSKVKMESSDIDTDMEYLLEFTKSSNDIMNQILKVQKDRMDLQHSYYSASSPEKRREASVAIDNLNAQLVDLQQQFLAARESEAKQGEFLHGTSQIQSALDSANQKLQMYKNQLTLQQRKTRELEILYRKQKSSTLPFEHARAQDTKRSLESSKMSEKFYQDLVISAEKEYSHLENEKFKQQQYGQLPTIRGANVKIDTSQSLDLRPTSMSVEAMVVVKEPNLLNPLASTTMPRHIPISVKILPINISDFSDIYNVLIDDLYVNKFSSIYKALIRSSISKILKILSPVTRRFANIFIPRNEFNLWKDVLYNSGGMVDASSFKGRSSSPATHTYASGIVIMSKSDIRLQEENFFANPSMLSKLFSMGWTSFAIMDDPNQVMTFCSRLERGMCSKIPYRNMFRSLNADTLFQDLDSLSKFTTRIVGRFKKSRIKVGEALSLSLASDNKIRVLVERYRNAIDELNRV